MLEYNFRCRNRNIWIVLQKRRKHLRLGMFRKKKQEQESWTLCGTKRTWVSTATEKEETVQQSCMMRNFKAFVRQDVIETSPSFSAMKSLGKYALLTRVLELVTFFWKVYKGTDFCIFISRGNTKDHTQDSLHLGSKYT